MFRRGWLSVFCSLLAFAAAASVAHAGLSFDTGASPEEARDLLAGAGQPNAPADSWLRIRGMEISFVRDPSAAEIPLWLAAKPTHSLAERRAALEQLQAHGFHLVALLRWDPLSWPHGIRSEHSLRRLPLDLRDAFDRCRALAASYGDLIDYWEIENEPDIGFVEENPETYAAFLKACYLGIAAGRSEDGRRIPEAGGRTRDDGNQMAEAGRSESQKAGTSEDQGFGRPDDGSSALSTIRPSAPSSSALRLPASDLRPPSISTRSRVLMAPLALPPGPYFSAFLANGGLRYTDGFNYHYYGYAEDFTGVYEQFREAIRSFEQPEDRMAGRPDDPRLSAQTSDHPTGLPSSVPRLPSSVQPPSRPSAPPAFRPSSLPPDTAVLATRFYPSTSGWSSVPVFDFDFPATDATAHRAQLQARPLAEGEPKLGSQGRWLVSSGVTVEEVAGSWRIRVDHLPAEPMRPAMAELPLPDGWRPDPNALLSFVYRIVPPEELDLRAGGPEGRRPEDQRTEDGRQMPDARKSEGQNTGKTDAQLSASSNSEHSTIRSSALQPSGPPAFRPPGLPALRLSSPSSRPLSVFLTEYGYGLLSKEARNTPEGRARQASWFQKVQSQIHALGITGAMAFLLKPYLENDRQEFGLLMSPETRGRTPDAGEQKGPETGKPGAQPSDHPPIGSSGPPVFRLSGPPNFRTSPALSALTADSATPIPPQSWSTSEPLSQTSIVIDFVAGAGLNQSKNFTGYLARGDFGRPGRPASAQLVLYNFGPANVAGDLQLTGESWTLADASHAATLTLAPGERRELSVLIAPIPLFAPQPATVTFRPQAPVFRPPTSVGSPPSSVLRPPSSAPPEARPIATNAPGQLPFDVYIRTADGNLFTFGTPLEAMAIPERDNRRLGNLTMAFFGRAAPSWSFVASEPAALVLFLRPTFATLPITLELRDARIVQFAPSPEQAK